MSDEPESIYRAVMEEAAHYERSDDDEWEVVEPPVLATCPTCRTRVHAEPLRPVQCPGCTAWISAELPP